MAIQVVTSANTKQPLIVEYLKGDGPRIIDMSYWGLPNVYVAAQTYIGPGGEFLSRQQRPNDYKLVSDDIEELPYIDLSTALDFEGSSFWVSNIHKGNHPLRDSIEDENGALVCAVVPNRAPQLELQELFVFPNSKIISLSQLDDKEILALGILMQNRYREVLAQGFQHIYFTLHFGPNSGGSSEHFHIQLCATRETPQVHKNIYDIETKDNKSLYEDLRNDGKQRVAVSEDGQSEIYVPINAHNPLAMNLAFLGGQTLDEQTGIVEYVHFNDMSLEQLFDFLRAASKTTEFLEKIPSSRTNGALNSYSAGIMIPPQSNVSSPISFNILAAGNPSDIANQFVGPYTVVAPEIMRDQLAKQLACTPMGFVPVLSGMSVSG